MDRIKLTLAAVLSGIASGTVVSYVNDQPQQIEIVGEASAVELTSADAPVLLAEMANAGARGTVRCAIGAVSNYPDRCYCTDGGTAGWLTVAADCRAEVEERDGKVFAVERRAEAEERRER